MTVNADTDIVLPPFVTGIRSCSFQFALLSRGWKFHEVVTPRINQLLQLKHQDGVQLILLDDRFSELDDFSETKVRNRGEQSAENLFP